MPYIFLGSHDLKVSEKGHQFSHVWKYLLSAYYEPFRATLLGIRTPWGSVVKEESKNFDTKSNPSPALSGWEAMFKAFQCSNPISSCLTWRQQEHLYDWVVVEFKCCAVVHNKSVRVCVCVCVHARTAVIEMYFSLSCCWKVVYLTVPQTIEPGYQYNLNIIPDTPICSCFISEMNYALSTFNKVKRISEPTLPLRLLPVSGSTGEEQVFREAIT